MDKDLGKSSMGIQPNAAALLCYLAGFVTGIVFFVIEKENKFVRFHALQSTITFGALFVLQFVFINILYMYFMVQIISIASLILWIILMVKAYQGEMFKLPVIGDIAEKQLK